MKKYSKGFTLIELLVVIAIIGILSSVVLASLNIARSKGNDAAVKSQLATARPQAEIYYDENGNSYEGVCTTATGTKPMLDNLKKNDSGAACKDSSDNWSMSAKISGTGNNYWCVDSTGASKQTTAEVSATSC